jgi:hypothetical protein
VRGAHVAATMSLAVGPIAWSVDFLASYVLVGRAGAHSVRLAVLASTGAGAAFALAGAVTAAVLLRSQRIPMSERGWRLVARAALGLDCLCLLLLAAMALPALVLPPGG